MKQPLEDMPQPTARPNFETVYVVGLSFLRQALRWLGVAERDLDDVLQEVMLAAYRGLDGFDPAHATQRDGAGAPHDKPGHAAQHPAPRAADAPCDPLKRWLFGIAWRQVGHYRGRAHHRREVAVGAGVSWPFDPADPGLSSEQLLAREERSQLVNRVLGALDFDRRVVLIMHDVLDVPFAEIARELDLKENTVRNRLRLAREDFRVAVKRMNAEERRALRTAVPLSVAELSRAADEETVVRAARAVPEAPDHVRRRIWAALQRTLNASRTRDACARTAAAAPA
jgi:RNA polymerase sigma-70 factor, ECF subfamily